MKNVFIVLGCFALLFLIASFFETPESQRASSAATEKEPDPNTATIELGQAMIGELVKPGQTLIRVIQSPPEPQKERGLICFAYFESGIGSEYVLWNPNTQRTMVFHSNGLVEVIPSGRADTWDEASPPSECKAGRDKYFRKVVRQDLLYPSAQQLSSRPKN